MAGSRETIDFPATIIADLSPDSPNLRLDKFLTTHIPQLSRSMADQWLQAGRIAVNDQPVSKKSHQLSPGDAVTIAAAGEAPAAAQQPVIDGEEPAAASSLLFTLRPRPLAQLPILFEDDDVIVINKPPGLVVHPGAGTEGKTTMVEGLLHYLGHQPEGGAEADLRPGIVHRLDKDTSGAIVWAKNPASQRHLAQQFQDKSNLREYIALVIGVMEEPKTAVSYQYRDPYNRLRKANLSPREYEDKLEAQGGEREDLKGYRRAVSHFFPIKTFAGWLSLVKVRLETGRTHQIRSHALWLNRPVLGDPLYGRALTASQKHQLPARCRQLVAGLSRQMLHGRMLGFEHPTDGRKLAFQAPFSPDMKELLEELERATAE